MNNIQQDPFFFQYEQENDFNLTEALYKYLGYWKWLTVSIVLSLTIAFFYIKAKTPLYDIESSILIKDDSKGQGPGDMLKQLDLFSGTKVVDNEIEVLKSYTLMEKAVSGLNQQVSYFTRDNFKGSELYGDTCPLLVKVLENNDLTYTEPLKIDIVGKNKIEINGKVVPLNTPVRTPNGMFNISLTGKAQEVKELTVRMAPLSEVIEDYMELLKVAPSSKMSSVLLMSFESSVPQKGKDLLNRLIDEYDKASLEDKNRVTYNTLTFIDKRLKLVSLDLIEAEKEVESYKSHEGITDISEESKLFLENVQQNDLQLNQVQIQQGVLNSIDQYVSNNENRQGTVPATLGIDDPTLLDLIDRLAELETKREGPIKLMKQDNPLILAIDKQIRDLKNSIKQNVKTLQKSFAITKQKLESQNANMESLIKTIPGKERTLVDITRQQTVKNDIYVYLLQKREETALSYASAVSDSRIIDQARSGNEPVKPVKRNVYLIFALIGFALPIGIIYILDLLNNKIKNRKDIEHATNIPILAEISFSAHENILIVNRPEMSVLAEQIRALRTNLAFLSPGQGVQCLLFTSSLSGEGKSFISLNLGASLAMIGKKTVILELDMRRPKLHSALNIPNAKGISDYLIGAANLNEILQPIEGQDDYYIIPCGPVPHNPVELLIKGRLHELITELRSQFDQIIIDAPPVGIVTDAQILEQYADATVFLVRHDFTPKTKLKLVNDLFKQKKFKNLNLVFNAIKEGGKYGYGYGYQNKYGYGYIDSKPRKLRSKRK
jgi:tyrosine-protein kinase Etk/Wzc